jgi:O-antigen/teichoic acid export membrane protein
MRLLILLSLLLASTNVFAYVGPGLGLGVLGTIIGAIAAVLLAIFGIIWYPIKRMIKKKKAPKTKSEEAQATEQKTEAGESSD